MTPLAHSINLLAELIADDSHDWESFLKRLMTIILTLAPSDACLIYVYNKDLQVLTLVASARNPDKPPHVTLRATEGITGWAATHQQIVVINEKAYADPRFKTVSSLEEDTYESFLSIPITIKQEVIGVINLQNRRRVVYTEEQIATLEAMCKIISSGFAATVAKRKIKSLEQTLEDRKIIEKAKGILMETKHISEKEAFGFLRSEAMRKRVSMRAIADAVLLIMDTSDGHA
jgi:signal transduction protein with GAF and PtsI domain